MKSPIARKTSRKVDDRLRVQRLVEAMFDSYYAEKDKALDLTTGKTKSLLTFGIFRVSLKDIATSLNLKNTKSNRLPYLIQDVLTGMDFCSHYGNWIFAEHEMDTWHFVELPEDSALMIRIVPSPMEGKLHYGKHSVAAQTCMMDSEWLYEDTEIEIDDGLDEDEEELVFNNDVASAMVDRWGRVLVSSDQLIQRFGRLRDQTFNVDTNLNGELVLSDNGKTHRVSPAAFIDYDLSDDGEEEISEDEVVEVATGIMVETYLNYLEFCPSWTNYKLIEYAQTHKLPVTSGRHTAAEIFSAVHTNIIGVLIGYTHSSKYNVETRRHMFSYWRRLLVAGDVLERQGELWTVTDPTDEGGLVVENEAKGTRRVPTKLFHNFEITSVFALTDEVAK